MQNQIEGFQNGMIQNGNMPADVPTLNHQLIAHEGYFYLCDAQMVAAYPVANPLPGLPSAQGNEKFVWSADTEGRKRPRFVQQGYGVRQHPYFCTIANERLFMVSGPEPITVNPQFFQGDQKQPSNFLVALGRQRNGGTLESGKLVWSLHPDSAAFLSHSKADQDWLKSVYFVSAPTYENGVLYTMAVHLAGAVEAWVRGIRRRNREDAVAHADLFRHPGL